MTTTGRSLGEAGDAVPDEGAPFDWSCSGKVFKMLGGASQIVSRTRMKCNVHKIISPAVAARAPFLQGQTCVCCHVVACCSTAARTSRCVAHHAARCAAHHASCGASHHVTTRCAALCRQTSPETEDAHSVSSHPQLRPRWAAPVSTPCGGSGEARLRIPGRTSPSMFPGARSSIRRLGGGAVRRYFNP